MSMGRGGGGCRKGRAKGYQSDSMKREEIWMMEFDVEMAIAFEGHGVGIGELGGEGVVSPVGIGR